MRRDQFPLENSNNEDLKAMVTNLEAVVAELTTQLTSTKSIANNLRAELEGVTQTLQDLQLNNASSSAQVTETATVPTATTLWTHEQDIRVIDQEDNSTRRFRRYKALIPRSRHYVEETEAKRLPRLREKPVLGDLVIVTNKSASSTDRIPQLGLIGVISQEPKTSSPFVEIEVYTGKTYKKKFTSLARVDPSTIEYPKANRTSEEEWETMM